MGCHFLPQVIFPTPGPKPTSPALAGGFFTAEPPGKPLIKLTLLKNRLFFFAEHPLGLVSFRLGKDVVNNSIRYSDYLLCTRHYGQCWEHRACKTSADPHLMELISFSGHVTYEEVTPDSSAIPQRTPTDLPSTLLHKSPVG